MGGNYYISLIAANLCNHSTVVPHLKEKTYWVLQFSASLIKIKQSERKLLRKWRVSLIIHEWTTYSVCLRPSTIVHSYIRFERLRTYPSSSLDLVDSWILKDHCVQMGQLFPGELAIHKMRGRKFRFLFRISFKIEIILTWIHTCMLMHIHLLCQLYY